MKFKDLQPGDLIIHNDGWVSDLVLEVRYASGLYDVVAFNYLVDACETRVCHAERYVPNTKRVLRRGEWIRS